MLVNKVFALPILVAREDCAQLIEFFALAAARLKCPKRGIAVEEAI
jgi:hypothetical protein